MVIKSYLQWLVIIVFAGFAIISVQVVAQPEAKPTQEETKKPFRAGPHGAYDPHASLSPEQHIQVALQHQQEGRSAEALNTLNQAIANHAKHAQLFAVRGSLLLQQGKVAQALQDFDTALALTPNDPLTLTNRAQAYRQFDRTEDAIADLDKAIELKPDLLAAHFNRGSIKYSQGDNQGALKDFEYCIAVDPHTAAPYFNRAAIYQELGKNREAVADLNRFIELSNNESWKNTAQQLIDKLEGRIKADKSPSG